MRKLTAEERIKSPGYARNASLVRWIYALFAVGLVGAWALSRWLPGDGPVGGSGLVKALAIAIPSVDIVAARSADPSLAAAVYGLQWLLAPLYLIVLFMMPPWSARSRAAVRYAASIRKFSLANKIFYVVILAFLVAYYLGDFRAIPFPTFLNGGLAPGNDPNWWLAGIYRSSVALGIYGAIIVLAECFFFWGMFLLACSFDICVLGKHAKNSNT